LESGCATKVEIGDKSPHFKNSRQYSSSAIAVAALWLNGKP